jgi:hypothetical protein
MKANFPFRMATFGLIIALGIFAVLFFHASRPVPVEPENNVVSTANVLVTNINGISNISIIPAESQNTDSVASISRVETNKMPGVYDVFSSIKPNQIRVVVDNQSGQYAAVSPNRQSITITGKNGNAILTTNIIEALMTLFQVKTPYALPIVGDKYVSSIQMINGYLMITVGKLAICVDKQTGHIIPIGAN